MEVDSRSYSRDVELGHGDLPSFCLDSANNLVNVLNSDGALKADHPGPRDWLTTFVHDSRALAVARHVLACPAGTETLDELSRRYGVARRTLERLFHSETGISLGLWRQKVRMLDSIRLLAEGKSVPDAALDSGYTSVSAFIAAFKHTFGHTPGHL